MSAFLYVPTTRNARPARRVDLADFGSLFADVEDPRSSTSASSTARLIAAACLILLFALGDTLLIARPDAVASCLVHAERTISSATI